MEDKELADRVHVIIHSLRLINGYKPSEAEKKISRLVLERFINCKECQEVSLKLRNTPEQKGFFRKLGDVINES